MENTLFLGNGFSKSVFKDIPSWSGLFDGDDDLIKNYTILYEMYRIKKGKEGWQEDKIKENLIQRIREPFSESSLQEDIRNLYRFGEYLLQYNVNNIITTNYDNGIELILCQFCGYHVEVPTGMVSEKIYSIRTHKLLRNDETGHEVKLWKIHGDLDRIQSITLGFDQYCGSLAKLMDYVKGTYRSSKGGKATECAVPMQEKCASGVFDDLSWVELFFKSNMYIVGFGMNFSEIDIWWLLNKRARFMLDTPNIKNKITFMYNSAYENEDNFPELFAVLKSFEVCWLPIESDANYINNIFDNIE